MRWALLLLLLLLLLTLSVASAAGPDGNVAGGRTVLPAQSRPGSPRIPSSPTTPTRPRQSWWQLLFRGHANNENERRLQLPYISQMFPTLPESPKSSYIFVDQLAMEREARVRTHYRHRSTAAAAAAAHNNAARLIEPHVTFGPGSLSAPGGDMNFPATDSDSIEQTIGPLPFSDYHHPKQQSTMDDDSGGDAKEDQEGLFVQFDPSDCPGWSSLSESANRAAREREKEQAERSMKPEERQPRFTVETFVSSLAADRQMNRLITPGSLIRVEFCEFIPAALVDYNFRLHKPKRRDSYYKDSGNDDDDYEDDDDAASKSGESIISGSRIGFDRDEPREKKLWLFTGKDEVRFQMFNMQLLDKLKEGVGRKPLPPVGLQVSIADQARNADGGEEILRLPVAELGVLPGRSAVETRQQSNGVVMSMGKLADVQFRTIKVPFHDSKATIVPIPRLPIRLVRGAAQADYEQSDDRICYTMTGQVPISLQEESVVLGVRIADRLYLSPVGYKIADNGAKMDGAEYEEYGVGNLNPPVVNFAASSGFYQPSIDLRIGQKNEVHPQIGFSSKQAAVAAANQFNGGLGGLFSHIPRRGSAESFPAAASAAAAAIGKEDDAVDISDALCKSLIESSPPSSLVNLGVPVRPSDVRLAGCRKMDEIFSNYHLIMSIRKENPEQWKARTRQEFELHLGIRPFTDADVEHILRKRAEKKQQQQQLMQHRDDYQEGSDGIPHGIPRYSSGGGGSVKSTDDSFAEINRRRAVVRSKDEDFDIIRFLITASDGRELGITELHVNFRTKIVKGPFRSILDRHRCMLFQLAHTEDWPGYSFVRKEHGEELLLKLRVIVDVDPEPYSLFYADAFYFPNQLDQFLAKIRKESRALSYEPHRVDRGGLLMELKRITEDKSLEESLRVNEDNPTSYKLNTVVDPQEIRLQIPLRELPNFLPMCWAQSISATVQLFSILRSGKKTEVRECWTNQQKFHQLDPSNLASLVYISRSSAHDIQSDDCRSLPTDGKSISGGKHYKKTEAHRRHSTSAASPLASSSNTNVVYISLIQVRINQLPGEMALPIADQPIFRSAPFRLTTTQPQRH